MSDSWDPGSRMWLSAGKVAGVTGSSLAKLGAQHLASVYGLCPTTLGATWAGFLSQLGASVSPSVNEGPDTFSLSGCDNDRESWGVEEKTAAQSPALQGPAQHLLPQKSPSCERLSPPGHFSPCPQKSPQEPAPSRAAAKFCCDCTHNINFPILVIY